MRLSVVFLLALASVAAAPTINKGKAFGNPNAPLQIELFSDFQCPSCRQLHMQILPSLMRDYVLPGKAYLVYKEFPLPMHSHAKEAAAYACAAARVGKYEKVADALFEAQPAWSVNGQVFQAVSTALTPAEQKKVQALAQDPAVLAEVQQDMQEGQLERVNQTPTMLIVRGGKKYPIGGTLAYDLLRRFLDDISK
ncbi:MAG: twin-arginine translocation pathway signal protein [Terriglobia bacterium]|nr:MAG: twin-arginine translocation pathway signal protein [Terriglobia bacterium]